MLVVIYIARRSGAGLSSLSRFVESIIKYPSGLDFRLVIVAKGWTEHYSELRRVYEIGASVAGEVVELPDDGFDWGAYFRISKMIDCDQLCFLNSHSVINGNNWLALLANALLIDGVGIAGATGSFGSWSFSLPYLDKNLRSFALYPIRVAKHFLGSMRHTENSPPFPNPHLRSNAFLIERKIFLEFSANRFIPHSKDAAHDLESGYHSITAFVLQKGMSPVVVGKNGNIYFPTQWPNSCTFRFPGQHNLLIADNQTVNYQNADIFLRRRLEFASWGRIFS